MSGIGLWQNLFLSRRWNICLESIQNRSNSKSELQIWPVVCHQMFDGWEAQIIWIYGKNMMSTKDHDSVKIYLQMMCIWVCLNEPDLKR